MGIDLKFRQAAQVVAHIDELVDHLRVDQRRVVSGRRSGRSRRVFSTGSRRENQCEHQADNTGWGFHRLRSCPWVGVAPEGRLIDQPRPQSGGTPMRQREG
ncbi:hypothetical protein ACI514_11420 [Pseudomonas sp. M20]|uniref:hypothetical protein n=1 Tax=Pseudomonas sp. M20 TaxID=3379129 RepID=UPI0038706B86